MDPLLDLYTWHTPNGRKPAILLAELELPYELHTVDISRDEQKRSGYLAINPNGKIPSLVDRDPNLGRVVVFESGAILQYLAEKYRRLLPAQLGARRAQVLSWVFWQVGGPGPIFGQLGKLEHEKLRDEHMIARDAVEASRLIGVLDEQLRNREFICDEYSIADIACYPWFDALREHFPSLLEGAAEVKRWLGAVGSRPAVRRGMKLEQPHRSASSHRAA